MYLFIFDTYEHCLLPESHERGNASKCYKRQKITFFNTPYATIQMNENDEVTEVDGERSKVCSFESPVAAKVI